MDGTSTYSKCSHILLVITGHGINSMVCQPDQEDTVISDTTCTGWIKYLLTHPYPDNAIGNL